MLSIAVLAVAGRSADAEAQPYGDPERARIQSGPLAVAPAIRLTNFGYDSNVFSENDSQSPQSDITGTLSPSFDAWLRLPGGLLSARTELDFVYFRELTQLRSLDTENAARLEFRLHRVRPYVAGHFMNTRHRFSFEIDEPVRIRREGLTVGAVLRLTGKTSLDVSTRRSSVDYDDSIYFGNDLSRLLDRTLTGERGTIWYEATPLTTIGFDVQRQRDRFDQSPERDSNRMRFAPVVEFRPHAVLSGRAQFGLHRREFIGRDLPDATGTFVLIDLTYTLLGSTRFGIQAQRDVEYSYRLQEEEYRLAGLTASVAQRFGDDWELRGRFGRHRLTYLIAPLAGEADAIAPVETLRSFGSDLTYRLGRTRLGFHVSYRDRRSAITAQRDHERIWIASSLAYAFE